MENLDTQSPDNMFQQQESTFFDPTIEQPAELAEDSVYSVDGNQVSGKDLLDALSKADKSAEVIDGLQKKQAELEMALTQMQSFQEGQQAVTQQQQPVVAETPEPSPSKVVQFFDTVGEEGGEGYVSGDQLRQVTEALVEDFTTAMQSSLRDPEIMRTAVDHRLQELGQEDQATQQVVGAVNQAYNDFLGTKSTQTNKSRESLDSIYKPALERVHRDRMYMLEGNDPATVLRGALDEVDRVIDNYDTAQNQPVEEAATGVEPRAAATLDVGRRFRTKLPEGRQRYFSEDEARNAFREGVKRTREQRGTFG
jgi:hypothetical protein